MTPAVVAAVGAFVVLGMIVVAAVTLCIADMMRK